jgi:hypothetical protein
LSWKKVKITNRYYFIPTFSVNGKKEGTTTSSAHSTNNFLLSRLRGDSWKDPHNVYYVIHIERRQKGSQMSLAASVRGEKHVIVWILSAVVVYQTEVSTPLQLAT